MDINTVDENLVELLTNTVNMTAMFYDIFLNPEPLDIDLQMYNDENELITVTIPNRAKDRITPYVGEGSPEGKEVAPIGAVYVDTATSTVYYKVSGDDAYGWNPMISQASMETFIRTYLEARGYITTTSLRTYLVTNEYVTVPSMAEYLTVNGYLRGQNLPDAIRAALTDRLILATDDTEEPMKDITIGNFVASIISSDLGNSLIRGSDSKLYVNDSDTGVVAGTYEYPKNLVVNSKGKITSLQQGSVATTEQFGVVKPDGITVKVEDGVISASGSSRNIGEIVVSTTPLVDAGLHLLDGAVIRGDGIYSDFVNYMTDLYNEDPTSNYFAQEATVYNISVIGSLLNNSGVLSGFSTTSYAQVPGGTFSPGNSAWEVVFKICTGSSTTTRQFVWASSGPAVGFGDIIIEGSKFKYTLSSTGNTGDICDEISGTSTVEVNTDYWVKVSFDGVDSYSMSYSTDGSTYTADTSVTSSATVYQGSSALLGIDWSGSVYQAPFLGTIDLNGSYIKIDGSDWWTGSTTYSGDDAWQYLVETYGVCGKYVYLPNYSANVDAIRLPKVTGFIEGTIDEHKIGDLVEAGLPNITGTFFGENASGNYKFTGAFYRTSEGSNRGIGSTDADNYQTGFSASNSNAIYGNSTTVQPQAVKVYYYVVIATTEKTNIQVDIDEIATDLNNKVDLSDLRECEVVVETYRNGTEWYRIWSDGWCEQGGYISASGDSGTKVVPLKVEYLSPNYTILLTIEHASTGNGGYGVRSGTQSTSQFTMWWSATGITGFYWSTQGYRT